LFVATTATSEEATPDERAPFRVWSLLFDLPSFVMAELVPAIYVFAKGKQTWMPATSAGMQKYKRPGIFLPGLCISR
jgi:hypothetical protein